jgi:hypothetical protein
LQLWASRIPIPYVLVMPYFSGTIFHFSIIDWMLNLLGDLLYFDVELKWLSSNAACAPFRKYEAAQENTDYFLMKRLMYNNAASQLRVS